MVKERPPSKTSFSSNKSKEVNQEKKLDANVDREGEKQVANNNDEKGKCQKLKPWMMKKQIQKKGY